MWFSSRTSQARTRALAGMRAQQNASTCLQPTEHAGIERIGNLDRAPAIETLDERSCVKLDVSSKVHFGDEGKMFDQLKALMGADLEKTAVITDGGSQLVGRFAGLERG